MRPSEQAVLEYLETIAGADELTPIPSMLEISDTMGLGEETIRLALGRLHDGGFIELIRTGPRRGKRSYCRVRA